MIDSCFAGPNQQTTKQPSPRPPNAPRLQGTQVEPNGNGIIFLRGVRSDNGRIILTRDDTIRLQDSLVALQSSSKDQLTLQSSQERQQLTPAPSNGEKVILSTITKDGVLLNKNGQLVLNKDQNSLLTLKDSQILVPVKDKERKDNDFGHVLVNANDVKDGVLLNKRQGQILLWGSNDLANGNVLLREKEEEIKIEKDEKMCVPVGSGKLFLSFHYW